MRPRVPASVIPCGLTAAGLAAGLLGASALSSGEVAVGVGWVLLGQAFDVLDGWAARKLGAVTTWGARFDYHCDVVVTLALLASSESWGLMGAAALLQTYALDTHRRISGRTAAAAIAVASAAF